MCVRFVLLKTVVFLKEIDVSHYIIKNTTAKISSTHY